MEHSEPIVEVVNIKCEYQKNPVGIDTQHPQFCWQLKGPGNIVQKKYRIVVADSREIADEGVGNMWDSGWVDENVSVHIVYGGKKLVSRGIYYWNVSVQTHEDNTVKSETAKFEMGLMEEADWQAAWVGSPASKGGNSLLFRKLFDCNKKLCRARVYICGLGLYELYINGQKAGRHVLDPAWTEYQKRVLYVTYDIMEYVKDGPNVIGVFLGNGWNGSCALLCQTELYYEDGSREIFYPGCHTSKWLLSAGPIVQNSIYDGEIYDARLEKPGWNTPEYDCGIRYPQGYGWTAPYYIAGPAGKKAAQMLEPIEVVDTVKPKTVTCMGKGVYVVDMGQNMAGWARIRVSGAAGTEVTMRYAEVLYEDGAVNQENLRTAMARDVYILKGDGEEEYEPRFTYHGFRYVQVSGYPGRLTKDHICGCVVRSAVEQTGHFESSSPLLNQIFSNILWTESSNLYGIPTDCPQRDERHGWLNDMTVRAEESIYNYNMSRFFPKWLNDIADTQSEAGAIADTAPFKWGYRPADPVSSSYLIIPWLLYLNYGDSRVIEQNYEGMKKWEEYLGTRSENGIVTYSYYGDWAGPADENVAQGLGDGAVSRTTPGILMSTGYYYLNAVLLSKMAKVLGKTEDEQYFAELAEKVKHAFHEKFYNYEKGIYASGSQAANAFALYLGIVPGSCRKKVLDHLVKEIQDRGFHLSTGNLGTKYVLDVLAENGLADTAMNLITQTTYPSWGYMITKGATTIWERWEYATGGEMNSHNHPMFASVGAWFYKYLAGIQPDETAPGFGTCVIKPCIVQGVDWIKASLRTVKGDITVGWTKRANGVTLPISIPCGSNGKIYLAKSCLGRMVDSVYVNEHPVWKAGQMGWEDRVMVQCDEQADFIVLGTAGGDYVVELELR